MRDNKAKQPFAYVLLYHSISYINHLMGEIGWSFLTSTTFSDALRTCSSVGLSLPVEGEEAELVLLVLLCRDNDSEAGWHEARGVDASAVIYVGGSECEDIIRTKTTSPLPKSCSFPKRPPKTDGYNPKSPRTNTVTWRR